MKNSRDRRYGGMVLVWTVVGVLFTFVTGNPVWAGAFLAIGVALAESQRGETEPTTSTPAAPATAGEEPADDHELLALNHAAHQTDGVEPFNEATRLAVGAGDPLRVDRVLDGGVAAAVAVGDAPVELAVHPDHRRQGRGRALVSELLDAGEHRFWAHGDLPAAQALASSLGLEPVRTLLVLRREGGEPVVEQVPAGTTIRTFRPDDADAVVRVNGRAFAHHPEQGAMDRADFDRRAASDWFDPEGLFVAEDEQGQVVGFHWTKVEAPAWGEPPVGEVYVVGVDPDHHGGGLGTALTARGLRHLADSGVDVVDLYVEGDNGPALAVYRRLGFVERARDVLYARPSAS
ncbi:mycothiol synthase [Aeromicrobium sp. REDSEA-S38_B2]|uniref:mycothiol synthase n=1 Tax=Aeromicrobium sp. REDSEA-S38_B2 TaxID=1811528 RepID=UPI000B173D7E|nr:mycothiol synthase [Aeromicrobium sp. REDSEA-S38_B2]